jgi:hypothetical protein
MDYWDYDERDMLEGMRRGEGWRSQENEWGTSC